MQYAPAALRQSSADRSAELRLEYTKNRGGWAGPLQREVKAAQLTPLDGVELLVPMVV
jgi:hypothetical protein